jgi:hypothetical protein
MKKKRYRGFYTLEAAVILPLFACFAVFLLLFFRALMVQWGIDTAMEKTAYTMALYGENLGEQGGTKEQDEKDRQGDADKKGRLREISVPSVVAATILEIEKNDTPLRFVQFKELGLDFHKTKVSGRTIDLVCSYRMPIVAGSGFFGKLGLNLTSRVTVGRWTGLDPFHYGKDDGDMVYVTEYGEDYHESLQCSYLKPAIHATAMAKIGEIRSRDHRIYHPCKECGAVQGGVVFYTDYGSRYHSAVTCPGLKRTIHAIPRSEAVKKYRPCPKCSNKTQASRKYKKRGMTNGICNDDGNAWNL